MRQPESVALASRGAAEAHAKLKSHARRGPSERPICAGCGRTIEHRSLVTRHSDEDGAAPYHAACHSRLLASESAERQPRRGDPRRQSIRRVQTSDGLGDIVVGVLDFMGQVAVDVAKAEATRIVLERIRA